MCNKKNWFQTYYHYVPLDPCACVHDGKCAKTKWTSDKKLCLPQKKKKKENNQDDVGMCSLSEHFIVLERFFFALTLVLFNFVFAPLLTLIAASPVANLKVRIMFGRFVGGKACPKHVCLGFVCLVD